MQLALQTQILAINDLFTPIKWHGEIDAVPSTKTARSMIWSDRWNRAKRIIEGFEPDWISIQFVLTPTTLKEFSNNSLADS